MIIKAPRATTIYPLRPSLVESAELAASEPTLLQQLGPDFTLCFFLRTVAHRRRAHLRRALRPASVDDAAARAWSRRASSSSSVLRFARVHDAPARAPRRWRSTPCATGCRWCFVAVVFDNLENYTGLVRKLTIDDTLYHIDLAVFGVEPTVWIQHLYHPLLTDWMASCYGIFLVDADVPRHLVVRCAGARDDFREIATRRDAADVDRVLPLHLPAGRTAALLPAAASTASSRRRCRRCSASTTALQATWDTYEPAARARVVPVAALRLRDSDLIYAWRFGDARVPAAQAALLLAGAAARALALLLDGLSAPSLDSRLLRRHGAGDRGLPSGAVAARALARVGARDAGSRRQRRSREE